jgi:hypothetical protein
MDFIDEYDYKLNDIQKLSFCEDEKLIKIIRITRAFNNNAPNTLIRYISQFRMDYPDFEFDSEVYLAKMHISNGHYQNAENLLKLIRNTMFLRIVGIKYLKNRIECNKDIGTLDIISNDVLQNIIIT